MRLVYQPQQEYDKVCRPDGPCLGYYSKKKMKMRFPQGGYAIAGTLGGKGKEDQGVLEAKGSQISFQGMDYRRFCYGVDGYILTEENQWLAVLESRIKRRIAMLAIPLALALMIGFGLHQMRPRGPAELGIDPGAGSYAPDIAVPEDMDPTRIAVPGYEALSMTEDTSELYAALWNPEANPCYFKFTILLEDTNEILYESGLVPPGKAITEVKLNQKMKAGQYNILIKMDTFSLQDKITAMNGGSSKAVLHVVKE